MDNSRCCICNDESSIFGNQIVFCDGCNSPIHQTCYNLPAIPSGDWFCNYCLYLKDNGYALSTETPNEEKPVREQKCCICDLEGGLFLETDTNDVSYTYHLVVPCVVCIFHPRN